MAKNLIVDNVLVEQTPYYEYLFKNSSIYIGMLIFLTSMILTFVTKIDTMILIMLMIVGIIPMLLVVFGLKDKSSQNKLDAFFVENKKENDYFLNFGVLVKEHNDEGAGADLKDTNNIISPLLFNEEWVRRHVDLPGTTGSGKTIFVKSLIQQILREIGSGFMMVEGKGANDMKHEIYAEVVAARRENDFFLLDFMNPHLSNTLNPLEFGDIIEITDFFIDMLKSGKKEGDTWGENSQALFSAVLITLLYLRDADCVWKPEFTKEINSIKDVEKYKSKASILVLQDILLTPYTVVEFALAIERLYKNDYNSFTRKLNKNNSSTKLDNVELDNSKENHVFIHQLLKNEIMKQVKEVPDFETLLQVGLEKIVKDSSAPDQVVYVIGVSLSQYSTIFGTFVREYGKIFAVENGDISVKDIINNAQILYVILQGINPTKAGLVAKFLLSTIRMVAKERGTKKGLLFPYPIFLDEFNSWSKGIEGFPDLMSVTRSLGFSFFIMHQSELSKIDDGKGIESGQARANMNITILLKTEDKKVAKEIIENLGKVKKVKKELKVDWGGKEDSGIHHSYRVEEEEALTAADVSKLKPGQAYAIVGGKAYKMVTSFIHDNTVYEIDDELPIPINKTIPKNYETMKEIKEKAKLELEKEKSGRKYTIVLDTETSALDNGSVLSISLFKLDEKGIIKDKITRYYYPDEKKVIEPEAIKVNGLNNNKINELRNDVEYPKLFLEDKEFYINYFKDVKMIVAHNISFDTKYLPKEIQQDINNKKIETYCTMNKNTNILNLKDKKGNPKPPKLIEACKYYNIEVDESKTHDSSYDTYLCYEIYKKMNNKIINDKQLNLEKVS